MFFNNITVINATAPTTVYSYLSGMDAKHSMEAVLVKKSTRDLNNILKLNYKNSRRLLTTLGGDLVYGCETFIQYRNRRANARYNKVLFNVRKIVFKILNLRKNKVFKSEMFVKKHRYGAVDGWFAAAAARLGLPTLETRCRTEFAEQCGTCPTCIHDLECMDAEPVHIERKVRPTSKKVVKTRRVRCAACGSPYGDECACTFDDTLYEGYIPKFKYNNFFQAHHPWAYIKFLKLKIKNKILELRLKRNSAPTIRCFSRFKVPRLVPFKNFKIVQKYQPEGDTLGGEKPVSDGGTTEQVQAHNVVITETRQPVVSSDQGPSRTWIADVSNDTCTTVPEWTDRWMTVGDFQWTTAHGVNAEVMWRNLPSDFYNLGDDCTPPGHIPVACNMYMACDMEIRIVFNGNKFQSGCLQVSWIYQDFCDANENSRANIYSLSQTNHVLLNASSEQDVVLKIPYKHSNPVIPVLNMAVTKNPLKLGTLRLRVINPLTSGVDLPTTLYGTIMYKMVNATYTGLRNIKIATPEAGVGSIVATAAAMKLLDTVNSDTNRDNPPLNLESQYVVPTGSHSWSAGTGRVDIPKILRLDTRGQTRHPDPQIAYDAFNVKNLTQQFSLLKSFKIMSSFKRGYHLLSGENKTTEIGTFGIACEPHFGGEYPKVSTGTGEIKNAYAMPPVSVISSLFSYWRGSLRFRFDIVASQIVTAKVIIGYVPNASATHRVTICQLMSSPHVILDIKEQQSMTYEVPYVAPTPWWPRNRSGNYSEANFPPPSRLYVMMYNPVVKTSKLGAYMWMNIYVSGGSDFEVSVPAQPSIGLSWDMSFKPSYAIHTLDDKYYAGSWNKFLDSTYYVLRYQTTSVFVDGVASWPDPPALKKGDACYYVCSSSDAGVCGQYATPSNEMRTIQYGVLHRDPIDKWYMIVCNSKESAQALATLFYKEYKYTDAACKVYYVQCASDTTNNTWSASNVNWDVVSFTVGAQLEDEYTIVHPEGDERGLNMVVMTGKVLPSTSFGLDHFGENFGDLMNLCRRYQLYGSVQLTKACLNDRNQCAFWFTCNPQGLNFSSENSVYNRLRDGPIPILLSGYRWFRGGLRFRIVFPQCTNTTIWIQHRPDRMSRPAQIQLCKTVESGQGLMNHGYAMELQLSNINSIVEVEVPYYQYGQYGLLQRPADAGKLYDFQYGLGQLVIGIQACKEDIAKFTDKRCDIYYSLADDFSPYQFYGFPPMILLDEIPEYVPQADDGEESPPATSWFSRMKDRMTGSVKEEVKASVSDAIKSSMDEVNKVLEDVKNEAKLELDSTKKHMIISFLSNMLHCLNAKNMASIAISFCSLLASIGILAHDSMMMAVELLKRVWQRLFPEAEQRTEKSETAVPEAGNQSDADKDREEAEDAASWVSLIFTGLCALAGCVLGVPERMSRDWVSMFTGIGLMARTATAIHTFVTRTFKLIKKIYNYIMCKTSVEYRLGQVFDTHTKVLKAWIEEAIKLVDPVYFDEHQCDKAYHDRLFTAYEFGKTIISQIDTVARQNRHFNQIFRLYDKLEKVRADLHQLGYDNHVRKMPTTFYMYGASGIGKSHLMMDFVTHLLREQNYPVKDRDLVCVISPLSKYWNTCRRQPVLAVDDMYNIQEGEGLLQQIQMLYEVVTPAPLSPPKADLTDKKMLYNPEIFYINSNYKYVEFNGVMPEALNRRRDFLIEVRIAPVIETPKAGCVHCDPLLGADPSAIKAFNISTMKAKDRQYLADYHHLEFKHCKNVLAEDWDSETEWMTWIDFKAYITPLYLDHRVASEAAYRFQLEKVDSLIADYKSQHEDEITQFMMGDEADADLFLDRYRDLMSAIKHEIVSTQEATLMTSWDGIQNECLRLCERLKERLVPNAAGNLLGYFKDKYNRRVEILESFLFKLSMSALKAAQCKDKVKPSVDKYGNPIPSVSGYKPEADDGGEASTSSTSPHVSVLTDADRRRQRFKYLMEVTRRDLATNDAAFSEETMELRKFAEETLTKNSKFCSKLRDIWLNNKCHDEEDAYFMSLEHFLPVVTNSVNMIRNVSDLWIAYCEYTREVCHHVCNRLHSVEFANFKGVNGLYNIDRDRPNAPPSYKANLSTPCMARCVLTSEFGQMVYYGALYNQNTAIRMSVLAKDFGRVPIYYLRNQSEDWDWRGWFERMRDWLKKQCLETIPAALRVIWEFVEEYAPKVLLILSFIGLSVTVGSCTYGMIKATRDVDKDFALQRAITAKQAGFDVSWVPESRYGNTSVPPARKVGAIPQGSQQYEAVKRILEWNSFYLILSRQGKYFYFRCVIVHDRVALVIKHYIDMIRNAYDEDPDHTELHFEYIYPGQRHAKPIPIDILQCERSLMAYEGGSPSNICVVSLPKKVPPGKNLLKFICDKRDLQNVAYDCSLYELGKKNVDVKVQRVSVATGADPIEVGSVTNLGIVMPVVMCDAWQYKYHGNGVCGSILLSPNLEKPIIGMHVAGQVGQGMGISEILCNEFFNKAPPIEKIPYESQIIPNLEDSYLSKFHVETDIVELGRVPKGREHFASGETIFVPTLIQGEVFPVDTEPNPLKAGDPRLPVGVNPLVAGVEKHGILVKDFDPKLLNKAKEHLKRKLNNFCNPIRANTGILELNECIVGVPSIPEFDALKWNTSAGYPLQSYKPPSASGKRWLFDLHETASGLECKGLNPRLENILNLEEKYRKDGIKPFTVFTDCLKDTCLPVDKCRVPGKTRIFSISPVQYTLAFRKYCSDFVGSFRRNRFDLNHMIGINPDGNEWNTLASRLLEKGQSIVTGDYSNFGPGLNASVAHAACECILEWYDNYESVDNDRCTNQRVRAILFEELICSVHLARDLLYYSMGGLPSGSPCTDVQNSLVNVLYILMAWMSITDTDCMEFERCTQLYVYGDDLIMSVNDEYCEIFNTISISNFLAQYDIKFTDTDKTGKLVKYRSLQDSQFLKRKFVPHPTRPLTMLAPLDPVSIHSPCNWMRKKDNAYSATIDNARQSLENAYGHGPAFYEACRLEIEKVLRMKGMHEMFLSWNEMDERVHSDKYEWLWERSKK